jgi:hypothetical protein
VGGWYSISWQKQHEAKGVAAALCAELSVAQQMQEGHVTELYRALLDGWKQTGTVIDRQFLVDLFEFEPQDTLPVYYSMSGKLGLLPNDIASELVEYHALIVGMARTIVRFLGKRADLAPQTVKGIGNSVEAQWNRATELRSTLITKLKSYSEEPVRLWPVRQITPAQPAVIAP